MIEWERAVFLGGSDRMHTAPCNKAAMFCMVDKTIRSHTDHYRQ